MSVDGNGDWPQWRGQARDGRVKQLPNSLTRDPQVLWTADLAGAGIGGIAVAENCVVLVSRDVLDSFDVVQAFQADSGEPLWKHTYEAKGNLDYGNSARATPLIRDGCVYTLGAFGDLHCLELESGIPLWHRNIAKEFDATELTWGHSGSPLIVADKLIVQPGGSAASLVALDPDTGETLWQSPGSPASYSSFMPLKMHNWHQIIGFDSDSMGGWDVQTGKRLWRHVPQRVGDFNVPTVLIQQSDQEAHLIVSSENNGTRLMQLAADGSLKQDPLGQTRGLAPDTHTPVVHQDWVIGVWNDLYALKLGDQFQTVHELRDPAFEQYCSVIASDDRILVTSMDGEVLLLAIKPDGPQIISRWKLDVEPASLYSHPAVADTGFYVRQGKKLAKLQLFSNSQ